MPPDHHPIAGVSGGRALAAAAALTIGIGFSAMLGWGTGIESLKRLAPGSVAVNPLTALCLMLAGCALLAHHRGRPRAGAVLGLLVLAAAAAKMLDLAGLGLAVDRLILPGLLDEPGGRPNRMAPNTALALLLAGGSLVLAGAGGRAARSAARGLALAVAMIALFAVVGYGFGIDRLTTVGAFIPMALPTGIALLALSVAMVALRPDSPLAVALGDRGPAGAMARRVIPLAVLVPVAVGAASLSGQRLGLYEIEAGLAMMVVGNVLVTSALLLPSILALRRSDLVRSERERALRRSEHLNRTVSEASPDCVSLLDGDGKVVFSNHAALCAYGVGSVAELAGKPWGHRLDEPQREQAAAALAVARGGGVGKVTFTLPGPDGVLRWFESLVSELQEREGEALRFIVMSREITQQKRVEEQVRWAATHDSLTGLPNRSLFETSLDHLCQSPARPSFALLLCDVDRFKQVNDTLGHDAGDALLHAVGQRLRKSVRKGDFVARLGGDEFAVILEGISSQGALAAAAEAILAAMKEPWAYDGRLTDCRVSIGASIALPRRETSAELLKKADIALYAAKVRGRGRIAVYEPAMGAEMQRRSSQISIARDALQQQLIRPSYQPKVELRTGALKGFEALLRWRHPTHGVQSPASLSAAFDDLVLGRAITERMLSCLLSDMRRWLDAGVEFGHVAVNASAADFQQLDFAERLLERLDAARVPPQRLQVEVTETVFLGRGADYVGLALKALSDAGIRIALDDFGTGYASLTHLKQFPVDVVKIDRSFLRDIQDPHNAAIIRTVVSLGRSLGLEVVAEGVETAEQEAYLIAEGCPLAQGYLYGKAVPAARVPALVRGGRGRQPIAA